MFNLAAFDPSCSSTQGRLAHATAVHALGTGDGDIGDDASGDSHITSMREANLPQLCSRSCQLASYRQSEAGRREEQTLSGTETVLTAAVPTWVTHLHEAAGFVIELPFL